MATLPKTDDRLISSYSAPHITDTIDVGVFLAERDPATSLPRVPQSLPTALTNYLAAHPELNSGAIALPDTVANPERISV